MKFFVAFIFIGLLVLAAMSARIFRGPIEAGLFSQARLALDERELQMVQVEFDHLDATLRGNVVSREDKKVAEEAVDAIPGARVTQNHITFGRDLSPRLVLVAGETVTGTGTLDAGSPGLSLGEEFDLDDVVRGVCAEMSWEKPLGVFANAFFSATEGGRLELDGRSVKLEGVVQNAIERWRLVDEADGMATDLDVVDRLTVADPIPFELKAGFENGLVKFGGVVRDVSFRDQLSTIFKEATLQGLQIAPSASSAPWLQRFPGAIRLTLDRAIDAALHLTHASVEVRATFPNEFWKAAAEQALREALPEGIKIDLDYRVAQKAEAVDAGEDDDVEREPVPIKILIAAKKMNIEGRVRLKEERDLLLRKLKEARPDLETVSALKFDWREPEMDSLRDAYPTFLAYTVSKIGAYGSIELHQDHWEVDAVSSDPHFAHWVGALASSSRSLVGVPCSVRVSPDATLGASEGSKVLDGFPIYFKPLSAQISPVQLPKLEDLAARLAGIDPSASIVLVGSDRGDGRLALQRVRAVRRFLIHAGLASGRFISRAGGPTSSGDWKNESVLIEIQHAQAGEDA